MSAILFSTAFQAKAYAAKIWGYPIEGHPDFLVLRPEGKTAQHSIEAVRAMISSSNMAPYQAACRFILIEEADRLGVVCSNALLKTLEEPFAHTTFLLASCYELLPTLASRCQKNLGGAALVEDKEIEERVMLIMNARGSLPDLFEKISDLEVFLEGRKGGVKLTKQEKENLTPAMQEQWTKEAEGGDFLEKRRMREQIAYYILKAFRDQHKAGEPAPALEVVEAKLKEILVKTERFIPLGAALESFFLEIN